MTLVILFKDTDTKLIQDALISQGAKKKSGWKSKISKFQKKNQTRSIPKESKTNPTKSSNEQEETELIIKTDFPVYFGLAFSDSLSHFYFISNDQNVLIMSKSDPILERLDFIKVKQIEIVGSEYSLSDFILHFGNIIISSKNVGILLEIEFVPSRFYHEGFKKMVSEIKENIYKQIPDPLKVLEFFSDKKLMVGKPKFEKKSKRKEDPNQNPNQDQDQNQNQNQEKKGNNDLIVDDNNNEIQIEIENENENKNKNKINKENQNENDSIPQNILTQLSNPEIDSSVNALRTSNSVLTILNALSKADFL